MGRKTIEVGKVLKMANNFLAAEHTNEDEREAICSFIESVLFESGNYEGFKYLEQEHHADGTLKTLGNGSRRYYFVNGAVRDEYDRAHVHKIRV